MKALAITACLIGGLLAAPVLAQQEPQKPGSAEPTLESSFADIQATYDKLPTAQDEASKRELIDDLYTKTRAFLDGFRDKANEQQLTLAAEVWLQIAQLKENHAGLEAEVKALKALKKLPDELSQFIGQLEASLAIAPGKPAPDWKCKDIHTGEVVTLSSLKGRMVLMDFWATWCPPCRSLMAQHLKALHEGYAAKEKEFLLVGMGVPWNDETADKEKDFAEKQGYHWKKVLDESGDAAKAYAVEGIPFLVLVDPEGKIMVAGSGWAVIEEVKKVLQEKLGAPAKTAEGEGKKEGGEKKDEKKPEKK